MHCLNVEEEVDDLRFGRKVQARQCFVEHQQFWLEHECACNRQPLALTAAEFHHRAVCPIGRNANFTHYFQGALATLFCGAAALNE